MLARIFWKLIWKLRPNTEKMGGSRKYDIYVKYILCPRIFFEELKAWRKPVLDAFNEEEKKRFAADPMEAWS